MLHFNEPAQAQERGKQIPLTTDQEIKVVGILNVLLAHWGQSKSLPPIDLLQAFIYNYENMAHYVACTEGLFATEHPEQPGSGFILAFQPEKPIDSPSANVELSTQGKPKPKVVQIFSDCGKYSYWELQDSVGNVLWRQPLITMAECPECDFGDTIFHRTPSIGQETYKCTICGDEKTFP